MMSEEARATDADAHYRHGQEFAKAGDYEHAVAELRRPSNCTQPT